MWDLSSAISSAKEMLEKHNSIDIVLVAHVLSPRGYDNVLQINCSETEHFTVQEFDEIYVGIVAAGLFIRQVFFSEFDFVSDVVTRPNSYASTIVFNLCRNGTGMNKKALAPAICDLLNITFTSSSAGLCALARNKWFFTSILSSNKIPCPASIICTNDLSINIPSDTTVIRKPLNGSASQGIDNNSISTFEFALSLDNDGMFIQEYVDGYECEVPIFCSNGKCFAMPPVGISFGNDELCGILSYDISKNGNYGFYKLSDVLPLDVCNKIKDDAEKSFNVLGLERYGRVDFKIDKNNQHYLIDVSTTPYITHHSSFAFSMNASNYSYENIFRLIVSATIFDRLKR